ncbi:MAG TPA: asparagine synthase (glutamine-hydrolyzing) [Candidatus Limnocylindrales bacterium]|nr:asparagine synthase (glutamine-hydrolyzing) [Candidatus Limnocylindrales bacterium]
MCGIAGVLNFAGESEPHSVDPLIESLTHRGPNGIRTVDLGPLQLGHARLSILDPSDAADQPMTTVDGRYTAVHNGEIYNFLELAENLRQNGHVFRTASDTEVLLAAYREWGTACVERFNGIWAFAVWDSVERRLFLSRDRLGVKPLFIARTNGTLAFASEIKALLRLPWVMASPQASAVRDFLLDGRVDHGRETFIAGVWRVPAAHNVVVEGNHLTEHRYWSPPRLSRDAGSRGRTDDLLLIKRFREALIDSVAFQLRSDVPIGSCLSGGLDSSTVVSIASALRSGAIGSRTVQRHERDRPPQLAFFADFRDPGISERRFVDEVVASARVELRTTSPTSQQALASLEAIVRAQDEPFGSTSIVAQYHVMRLAHESDVSVLLDGQGADELLGGYTTYRPYRDSSMLLSASGPALLAHHLRARSFGRIARLAWGAATRGAPGPSWLRPSRRMRVLLGERVAFADRVAPVTVASAGTTLSNALWRDVSWGSLPGLLRFEDRNSMAFGIEARVPFLDHRLVELGLALPDRLRVEGDVQKVILRRAFTDLVPKAVVGRVDKIGFASPEARWLVGWLPALKELTVRPVSENLGLVKPGGVTTAFSWWATGRISREVFWRLLSLEMWARVTISGDNLPWSGTAG